MSAEPQLVLDYASPRKRGKIRLPATSRLDVIDDDDGVGVRVVETLTAQRQAVFAIAFAVFVAVFLSFTTWNEFRRAMRRSPTTWDFVFTSINATVVAAELVMIVLVIRQTWRRTELAVDARRTVLQFTGPLSRAWRREWANDQLDEIVLVATQTAESAPRLAELHLRAPGMKVNLFTDHREATLAQIAVRLRCARMGKAPEIPTAVPALPTWDTRTLQRLRERRDELHDRLH